jgi:hypothetical protein
VDDELRSATDHLLLIKEHLRSLARIIAQLRTQRYSPAGVAALRHGMLDVRMVVEELMLFSVSAHDEAGREMVKAIRTEYRTDKKMSRLRRLNPRFSPRRSI